MLQHLELNNIDKIGNFLILFKDEVTSGLLARAIQEIVSEKSVFKATNTYLAMQVLMNIARAGEQADKDQQKELHVLLDIDMPFLEAYVFLNELYQTKFPFPIKVYLFGDPDETKEESPDISRYQGVKWIEKGPISETIEQLEWDDFADFFQHDKRARFPLYV